MGGEGYWVAGQPEVAWCLDRLATEIEAVNERLERRCGVRDELMGTTELALRFGCRLLGRRMTFPLTRRPGAIAESATRLRRFPGGSRR